ncbi:proline iminopeptidase [Iris pallida]|uniref:Proline iminopeptidase n=1 Tax=Iris pallida TaxID=29817 RepID=A0AAX6H502_IRIPA|nr:proline iminopeptidase [Iris pallida]
MKKMSNVGRTTVSLWLCSDREPLLCEQRISHLIHICWTMLIRFGILRLFCTGEI